MKVQIHSSILEIDSNKWNQLNSSKFPFASHEFLSSLESSQSLGQRTGWRPLYLTAWEDIDLTGALVLYQKTNSYGEYIFDFAWADAYTNSGLNYYPKLISAIPFTPATGTKLLIHPKFDQKTSDIIRNELIKSCLDLSIKSDCSSIHHNFITSDELNFLKGHNYLIRHNFQFEWQNNNYATFADFLSRLKAKKRKEIKRERRKIYEAEIQIDCITGNRLTLQYADEMYEFYINTIKKMQSMNYLTADYFRSVFVKLNKQTLYIRALNSSGQAVAGALSFYNNKKLYGRNWGCIEEYKFLHFELCYYQGIEFAISNKLLTYEAGAQGEHKLSRGFLPALKYSAHHIHQTEFSEAIRHYIEEEKDQVNRAINHYMKLSPYRE